MFKMQLYIIVVLLLSSGAVSGRFRKSVETNRVYSWYLSAVSTQLHFHHKLWGTTARWGL